MKHKKGLLYYIYCALGEKSHPHCNKTADRVALIRLLVATQIIITNAFIVAGVIKHWNDKQDVQVSSSLYETKEERLLQTSSNFSLY
jgi:hypothetical protein